MPRLMAAMYDWSMRATEAACLDEWRRELLRDAGGEVLEVGAGTGANLAHYGDTVKRLVLAEPDAHMRRRLQRRCEVADVPPTELSDAAVESLPIPDASFDGVVSTLVLCSVRDLDAAVAEIFRVLRPGGRFMFLEHVAAEHNPRRLTWQRRLEPVWKRVAGNCHLTRRTEHAILAAGFEIERIARESMRKTIPVVRPTVRGVARKPSRSRED